MNLYISNLGEQITNDSLWATFATYGEVSAVRLVKDHPRPGAYILMPNYAEAVKAVSRINGCIIDGKPILVEMVRGGEDF
jgi:RNA recognition motif-containing protein